MKPSNPGSLTLDVMRPVFLAVGRDDRRTVRKLCGVIIGVLNTELRRLRRERRLIKTLVARYGYNRRRDLC